MIKIKSLDYSYEDGTRALKDINMDFDKGRTIGIIGANGSGKSTLFLNILGFLRPKKGAIKYNGEKLRYSKTSLRNYRKEVTMVFQDPERQLFHSKVSDDVVFALRNLGYDEGRINLKLNKALEIVGAQNLRERPVHFLSHGQKKRITIAGALVMDSKVLLLDEPTSGLDPYMTREMTNIIKGLKDEKKIIISSHDMDFIYDVCDYIYVLGEGEILGEGRPEKLFLRTELLKKALLDKPWLVKVHENIGLPLCKSEKELYEKYKDEGD